MKSSLLLILVLSFLASNSPAKERSARSLASQEEKKEFMQYYNAAMGSKSTDSLSFYIGKTKNLARRVDDPLMTVLSYSIEPVYYAYKDYNKFAKSSEEYRKVAFEYNYLRRAFLSYSTQIQYAFSEGRASDAIHINMEMHDKAVEYNNTAALIRSYTVLGKSFRSRYDYSAALQSYRLALDVALKGDEKDMLSAIYLHMSNLYKEDADSALIMCVKALETATSNTDSLAAICGIASNWATRQNKAEFHKYLALYESSKTPTGQDIKEYGTLQFYDALFDKDWTRAELALSTVYDTDTLPLKRTLYESMGDMDGAYRVIKKQLAERDSLSYNITSSETLDMTRAIQEGGRRLAEAEKESQTKGLIAILLSLLVVAVAAFALIIHYKNKKEFRIQKNLTDKLQEAITSKERILQNISHEIRTPLNAIVGFSQLLSLPDEFTSTEEKAEYLSYITSNSDMLTMLIDDIIISSDNQKGNYIVKLSNANVNTICRNSLASMKQKCSSNIAVKFETDLDDSTELYTDELRVWQVLNNLISNSIKHTKAGSITLHAYADNANIFFSVTDTGTGIPADKADEIFERFTKLDRYIPGAGLGLNICKTIMEQLGGHIYLDSSYTNGARFIVQLPK